MIKPTIYSTWYFQLLEKSAQNYELQINTSMWVKTTFVPQQIIISFSSPYSFYCELWLHFPSATFNVYFLFFCSWLKSFHDACMLFPQLFSVEILFLPLNIEKSPSVKQWIIPQEKKKKGKKKKQTTLQDLLVLRVPIKSQREEVKKVMKIPQPRGKKKKEKKVDKRVYMLREWSFSLFTDFYNFTLTILWSRS